MFAGALPAYATKMLFADIVAEHRQSDRLAKANHRDSQNAAPEALPNSRAALLESSLRSSGVRNV